MHWAEDAFDRVRNRYVRHASGMLLVGVLMYVISRLWKQHATMAVVVEQDKGDAPVRVLGVIAKEHVADSVARSIKVFAGKH